MTAHGARNDRPADLAAADPSRRAMQAGPSAGHGHSTSDRPGPHRDAFEDVLGAVYLPASASSVTSLALTRRQGGSTCDDGR